MPDLFPVSKRRSAISKVLTKSRRIYNNIVKLHPVRIDLFSLQRLLTPSRPSMFLLRTSRRFNVFGMTQVCAMLSDNHSVKLYGAYMLASSAFAPTPTSKLSACGNRSQAPSPSSGRSNGSFLSCRSTPSPHPGNYPSPYLMANVGLGLTSILEHRVTGYMHCFRIPHHQRRMLHVR